MRWSRAGLALFAVHVALLFFPPLPPLYKGSLWSYLFGYGAVLLVLKDAHLWGPWVAVAWGCLPARARLGLGAIIVAAIAHLGWLLHGASAEVFQRFSREEGAWEPISLTCYAAAALLLTRTARRTDASTGRHLRLIGWCFAFLALEEIDYFGLFGGVIGRIDGIYTGSLHDLIRLAEARIIGEGALAAGVVVGALLVAALYRAGYIQPRRLWCLARSTQGVWLAAGFALLALGAAEEASLFGVDFPPPSPEELVETLGALCLGLFALEAAAPPGCEGERQGPTRRRDRLQSA